MCWGLDIQILTDSVSKKSFDLRHIGVITSGKVLTSFPGKSTNSTVNVIKTW